MADKEKLNPDSSSENRGEISAVELKDGPNPNRNCTDICCCLIFMAFIIATILIAIIGAIKGNPKLLATPFDPDR